VIGAPYSSNSRRLAEVAEQTGCAKAILIQHAGELDPGWLDGVRTLGLTAGASAPEILVKDLIAALEARFDVAVREVDVTKEDMTFSLPRVLTA